MAYEMKEGEFTLFTNDKGDNPKRPDRRGELMIGGRIIKLSGWIRESKKDGKQFLSGKWEYADKQPAQPPVQSAADSADPMPF